MEEPKPEESNVREERSKENTEPENIYVGTDGTDEVASRTGGKRFRVSFCVQQNLTPLLEAIFRGMNGL
jgi:hypothetical protein